MRPNRNPLALVAIAASLLLSACGTATMPTYALAPMAYGPATMAKTNKALGNLGNLGSVPRPSQFVTISCTVTQILPPDTSGLPHQIFDVQDTQGDTLEVDNDTHYGSEVQGLYVGERLTIRGVEYHDPNKDGIHWTHHANRPGDAGWIKTPDGQIYQ